MVRPDATYADLTLLILGMAGRLSDAEESDEAQWRRIAELTWAAVRA